MKRMLGIIALLCLPVLGSGALLIVVASVSALTAYQGLRAGIVYGMVAVLVGIELLYGIDIGVLSLSYLTAVLVVTLMRRFIALPAWASQRGWRPLDALQAAVLAYALFWMLQAGSIFVEHFVYGYGQTSQRLLMMAGAADMWWALAVIVVVLVILRRIDEPFRQRINFGT